MQTKYILGLFLICLIALGVRYANSSPTSIPETTTLPTKEDHIAMGHILPEDDSDVDAHAGHADHGEMIVDELSFIQLMIPHHQEAIDTTTVLLQTTTDPDLQQLGANIITAQQQEIAMMNDWLQSWYPDRSVDHSTNYVLMMRPTTGISDSATLDQMRTEDMIVHHEGAVQMAEKILILPQVRDEVKEFAREIIRVQGEEIAMMRSWLAQRKLGGEDDGVNPHANH